MKKSIRVLLCLTAVLLIALCVLCACNPTEQNTPTKPDGPQKLQLSQVTATVTQEEADGQTKDALTVTWAKVENATKYVVTITIGDDSDQINVAASETNYKKYITDEGTYTVKVKAVGDGINYTDSDEVTKTVQYEKPAAPEPVQLPAPKNLKYDNETKKITWDAVDNAKEYEVKLNDTTYLTKRTDFNMIARDDGTYTLTVKAIGDNEEYLTSETASITFTKEKLQAPITEKKELGRVPYVEIIDKEDYTQKIISWDPVIGVDKYELTLDYDYDTETLIIVDGNITEYLFTSDVVGKHRVKIRALANDDNERYYSSSKYATKSFYIKAPPITYQDVMEKLRAKIESALKPRFTISDIDNVRIQYIDAITDIAYVRFYRDDDDMLFKVDLNGISLNTTLEELNTFVENLEVTKEMFPSSTLVEMLPDETALQLVSKAIKDGEVSITNEDVNWCMATTRESSNYPTITIVTNNNEKITYNLRLYGTVDEYLAGEAAYSINNEQTTQYTELSQLFEDAQ